MQCKLKSKLITIVVVVKKPQGIIGLGRSRHARLGSVQRDRKKGSFLFNYDNFFNGFEKLIKFTFKNFLLEVIISLREPFAHL